MLHRILWDAMKYPVLILDARTSDQEGYWEKNVRKALSAMKKKA